MNAESAYTVPALEKGMRILEDLAQSAEPLTAIELANIQGRGRNEIYRMLCSLESLGYITREEQTKRYSLSLKLFQMANLYPPMERLQTVARQPLQSLADRISESCHLCVMDASGLSVVLQASGSERIRVAFQLGARFDPLETCSGLLLLSELDENTQINLLETSAVWEQSNTSARKSLLASVSKPPRRRLLEEDSQLRPGIRDMAVALGSPETIHATVAVAHLTNRANAVPMDEIRKHLISTASDIEQRLGINTSK